MNHSLSAGNYAFHAALTAATGALWMLDDAGVTVLDIDVRGGRPVLQVDRPPAFVTGVATVTRRRGETCVRKLAAPYRGVQIEWDERVAMPRREATA